MLRRFRIPLACVLTAGFFASSQRGFGDDVEMDYTIVPIPTSFDVRAEFVAVANGLNPDPEGPDAAEVRALTTAAKQNRSRLRITATKIIGGDALGGSEADFDNFFKLLFAEMTQVTDEDFELLSKRRQDLFIRYIYRAEGEVRKRLIDDLAFTLMKRIADNQTWSGEPAAYHPAVRYNAMLIIGKLNRAEAVTRGNVRLPVAHTEARAYMLGKFKDEAENDGVRVAALLGLLRHAELDGQLAAGERMDGAQKRGIINAMKDVINAPPGKRTPEGHAWLQRRAIQVLGAFRDPGAVGMAAPVGDVAAILTGIINDESKRLSFRCTAAAAYGQLNFPPSATFDKIRAIDDLARIAVKACQDELAFMKFQLDKLAKEKGPVRGGRPVAVAPEAQVTELSKYQLDRSRRAIKFPVECIQNAIGKNDESGARRAITDEAENTYAGNLAKSLYQLYQATSVGMRDEAAPTQAFAKAVSRQLQGVRKTLAASPSKPAPKPPEEAEKTEDKKEDDAFPPGLK